MVSRLINVLMFAGLLFVAVLTITSCSSDKREVTPTLDGNPPKCVVVETYDTDWTGTRMNRRYNTYCLQEK
jgi:hypothetical protein